MAGRIMESPFIRVILRYSTFFARLAVGAVFLSNVADRLGLWGPPGTGSVAWGNLENYYESVRALNPYLPEIFVPVLGWFVNIAEIILGLLLIAGYKTRWAGFLSGLLLLTFALANAVNFGIKVPLNYSIFSAAGAALLIASQRNFPLSVDHMMTKPSSQHHVSALLVFVAIGFMAGCAGDRHVTSAQQSPATADQAAETACSQFIDDRPTDCIDGLDVRSGLLRTVGTRLRSGSRWRRVSSAVPLDCGYDMCEL